MREAWLGGGLFAVMMAASMALPTLGEREARRLTQVRADCAGVDAARIVDHWTVRGVVRDIRKRAGAATVEVNTRLWAEIGHEAQISIAVAAFCQVADASGRGSTLVSGSLGEGLGAVVDGIWSR